MHLQTGDLLFVRGDDFISDSIEVISGSAYSHVAIIVDDKTVIEAQGFRKVGFQPIEKYRGRGDVLTFKDGLTHDQRQKILDFAESKIGSRYSYPLILWKAMQYLLKIMWVYKAKPDEFICSTLARDAYLAAGIDLTVKQTYPSPGDLVRGGQLVKIGEIVGEI